MKKGELSKIIKAGRLNQGLSLQQLANKAGVTKRAICYWESGEREITVVYADKVLKALDISVTLGATSTTSNT